MSWIRNVFSRGARPVSPVAAESSKRPRPSASNAPLSVSEISAIPEVYNAEQWILSGASRIRLVPAILAAGDVAPTPIDRHEHPAIARAWEHLLSGPIGQPLLIEEFFRGWMRHGRVRLEAVRLTPDEQRSLGTGQQWLMRLSADAGASRAGTRTLTWQASRGVTISRHVDPDDLPPDVVVSEYVRRDHTPARVIASRINGLVATTGSVESVAMSQIVQNKFIITSSDITIPGGTRSDDVDPLFAAMVRMADARAMIRGTPRAATPSVFRSSKSAERVPASSLTDTIDLSTSYDERVLDIAEWYARTVANVYSVPVEVVTGENDNNHWDALQKGQDGARIVLARPAQALCQWLVEEIWHYMLALEGVPTDQILRSTLVPDTSALVQDPDRSPTLIALYQATANSPEGPAVTTGELRRAVGLPEDTDKPTQTATPSRSRTDTGPPRLAPATTTGAPPAIRPLNGQPMIRPSGTPRRGP